MGVVIAFFCISMVGFGILGEYEDSSSSDLIDIM